MLQSLNHQFVLKNDLNSTLIDEEFNNSNSLTNFQRENVVDSRDKHGQEKSTIETERRKNKVESIRCKRQCA